MLLWLGFIAFVILLLAVDLGVFHRRAHQVRTSEAVLWTTIWVVVSLLFNVAIFFLYEHHILGIGQEVGHALTGKQAALQFFTGYIIEKSLSLDNIFVIAVIFTYFGIPSQLQHRVLFYGILGALILRGGMIAAGTILIQKFWWITYVFGALLIFTAIKMLIARPENIEPDRNPLVRLARRLYPVSTDLDGQRFFTQIDGKRAITPLLLVLLVVESTDILFAVDSIPAILAVTQDPFLVFTSNVCAILGLRALYFVLASVMDRFRYLKMSLVFLLAYIGVKMLLTHYHPIPTVVSLAIITTILGVGIVASILAGQRDKAALPSPPLEHAAESQDLAWRQIRRVLIVIAGAAVTLIGLAMIVLPGPAIVVIPAGLTILGTELLWARKLLAKAKALRAQIGSETDSNAPAPADADEADTSLHQMSEQHGRGAEVNQNAGHVDQRRDERG